MIGLPGSRMRAAGFTLLEVVVALAIIAIGLGAIISLASRNLDNASILRDTTLAHWVASNKVVELQVADEWPGAGTQTGDVEMAGRDWYWKTIIIDTFDERVRRVDVEVRTNQNSERPLASVIAYIGQPS